MVVGQPTIELWWHDPRWWAIIVSLIVPFILRGIAKREDRVNEEFDACVGAPLRETYKELRTLASEVSLACDLNRKTERTKEFKRITEDRARQVFGPFWFAAAEADKRLGLNTAFADVAAKLEDVFYVELDKAKSAENNVSLRACAKKVSIAIIETIDFCDKQLRSARKDYKAEANDKLS